MKRNLLYILGVVCLMASCVEENFENHGVSPMAGKEVVFSADMNDGPVTRTNYGDPVTNTSGTTTAFKVNWADNDYVLVYCLDSKTSGKYEVVPAVDENGEYILVTSRCIASDITDYRRTNELLFPLHINDVAMVMSDVPNGRALAKCILIDEDDKYTLNQRICCFRYYSFNPIFFYHLLNRHEYFLSFNDGNAQTNLRKDDLLACSLIVPPIELQNEFATFVEQTDKLKFEVKEALEKLEILKKSLMQQYFG